MSSKVKQVIFTVVFGTIACWVIGIISYGFVIFSFHDTRSLIVLYGVYGSIYFSVVKYLKRREQIVAVVFMILAVIILRGRTHNMLYYLRDVYLLVPLFVSILLYMFYIDKNNTLPLFVRGLSLVVFFPLLYEISLLLLLLILGINLKSAFPSLLIQFRLSIMISVGLAVGFDLYEKYKEKINLLFKIG